MVSDAGYEAARRAAAAIDRSDRGLLFLSGKDRASYLHGLLTNDIAALRPGEGCYAAYLTPQGRMITDLWVYELGDAILVALGLDIKGAILAKLDRLIFTEEVQISDRTDAFGRIAIVGPESGRVTTGMLGGVTLDQLMAMPEHGNLRAEYGGQPAIVLRITDPGEPGFEILVDPATVQRLQAGLAERGVIAAEQEVAEALRIEGGIPKFHQDMDETTIPLEAGIESRAISFTKGCYVGQEVIVRVLHRGHGRVARKLVGLVFDGGDAPERGAAIHGAGHDAGQITSSVMSPGLKRAIALGYVPRDLAEPGTTVDVAGRPAIVSALPFVRP